MSFRGIFTADIHCSNALPFALRDPETLVADRLLDTLGVLDEMSRVAIEQNARDIFILGDLVDKRLIDAVTLKMVTAKLKKLQKEGHTIHLLPGNHEAYDAKARHFVLDAYADMDVRLHSIAADPACEASGTFLLDNDMRVAALPYQPDEVARQQLLKWAELAKHEPMVLMLHQTIKGAKVGEWECPEGIEHDLLAPFSSVLSGHFHTPQTVSPGVHYLGAPVQHSFSDVGDERGFWIIDIDHIGMVKMTMVPVKSPRFFELSYPSAHFAEQMAAVPGHGDYVKIRVTGSEAEVKQRMKSALEACEELKQSGCRYAQAVPAPEAAPQGAKRRLAGSATEKRSWSVLLNSYIDACDITGLTRTRLEAMGQELVQAAEG